MRSKEARPGFFRHPPDDRKACLPKWKVYFTYNIAMKNRLKVLRAERNWSQLELAERLGVSRQTINAIEAERYDPSLPLAIKIAKLFGQPVETIFELED
jgi:putative transcriptional regulator